MFVRPHGFALLAIAATVAGCGHLPSLSAGPVAGVPTGKLGATSACAHTWVFSDLGANTLVDTSNYDFDNDTGEISPVPGAQEYLAALSKQGFPVGLIVNVPEDWGPNADAKIFRVIDMIDRAWSGPTPFDWSLIGQISGTGAQRHFTGRFLVPDINAHRKPDLFLFKQAVALAGGCNTLYMGAIANEAPAARAAGMAAYTVANHTYLPVDQIDGYAARTVTE